MLPKLLMNGIKLESIAPTQEQVAHQQDIPYKAKYQCKFCEMYTLWLDNYNLALFFQILALFFAFLVLKHFQKWNLKFMLQNKGFDRKKNNKQHVH